MSNLRHKLTNIEDTDLSAQDMLWLEPDNKVWQSVRDQIPIKKQRRWPFFMMVAASLLTIFGLFSWMMSTSASNKLAQDPSLENLKQAEIVNAKEGNNQNMAISIESRPKSEAIAFESEESAQENLKLSHNMIATKNIIKNSHITVSNFKRNDILSDLKEPSDLRNNGTISNNADIISPTNITDLSSHLSEVETRTFEQETQINLKNSTYVSLLPYNYSELLWQRKIDVQTLQSIEPIKVKRHLPTIGLVATYSPLSNNKDLLDPNLPLSEAIKSTSYHHHRSLGIQVSIPVSKSLSIIAMPRYSTEDLSTSYALGIPYNYLTETSDGHQYINSFTHSLPTDAGQVNTTLVVTRSLNSPVEHNEIVNFDLGTDQELRAIELPLLAEYKIGNKRHNWGLMAGGIAHLTLSNIVSTSSWISHHQHVSTHSSHLQKESNDTSIKLGASLGVNYSINMSPHLSMKPMVMYHRFFASHHRQQLVDAGLMIQYRF